MTEQSGVAGPYARPGSAVDQQSPSECAPTGFAATATYPSAFNPTPQEAEGSGWMETAKEKATEMGENMAEYVQRNPFSALGIAVGIGFVAGLILKRR